MHRKRTRVLAELAARDGAQPVVALPRAQLLDALAVRLGRRCRGRGGGRARRARPRAPRWRAGARWDDAAHRRGRHGQLAAARRAGRDLVREALGKAPALPETRRGVVEDDGVALERKFGEARDARIGLGAQHGVAGDPHVREMRQRREAPDLAHVRHEVVAQVQLREAREALDATEAVHAVATQVERADVGERVVDAEHAIDQVVRDAERLEMRRRVEGGRHGVEQVVAHVEVRERR